MNALQAVPAEAPQTQIDGSLSELKFQINRAQQLEIHASTVLDRVLNPVYADAATAKPAVAPAPIKSQLAASIDEMTDALRISNDRLDVTLSRVAL